MGEAVLRAWHICVAAVVGACVVPAAAAAYPHDGLTGSAKAVPRSTPRETITQLQESCSTAQYRRAAHLLDLRPVPQADRDARGPILARELCLVLGRKLWIDPETLPAVPEGDPATGAHREPIGTIPLNGGGVDVSLTKVATGPNEQSWLIAGHTIENIPELYDVHGPGWLESKLPPWLTEPELWDIALWQWLGFAAAVLLAVPLALLATFVVMRVGIHVAQRTDTAWDDHLLGIVRGPLQTFFLVVFVWGLVEALQLRPGPQIVVSRVLQIGLTVCIAWFLMRLFRTVTAGFEQQAIEAAEAEGDDHKARGVQTQMRMLQRVASVVVGVVAGAVILLQFESVRTIGMSLLASAGILGIVFGLAAQRSLGTMLAGIQLSITQPVRIGDTVIVQGEWGTVEEITLTYVIIRIWDERRLVVPVNKLLDEPTENWTRTSRQLLGTVFVYADYALPVSWVRQEVERLLDGHPHFDGRMWNVLVTGSTERTVEIRIMASAKNASDVWALRCSLRENLIAWLQELEQGRYLPRARVELERDARSVSSSGDGTSEPARAATRGGA